MAKFTGTHGKDNFKGGSGRDVFYFDVRNLSPADKLSGGGGLDALVLINNSSSLWATVKANQWHGLSSIEGVALGAQAGAFGFKLAFDNSFFHTNKVKQFEIYATELTGVAQGLHVTAAAVKNMSFKIDGTLGGGDQLKTGAGNDTFVYVQDSFDVNDKIDGGGGVNTLVLAGAGKVTPVRDGPDFVSPDGHSFLADVKHIDHVVVTALKHGQSRSIGFGNLVNTAHYTGTGVIDITTNQNYGSGKKATAIAGELIVDGARLKASQILHVTGGNAGDQLVSGAGNDRLGGGLGNDRITGGAGKDALSGDAGNDILIGGLGGDTMNGGSGSDVFVISDTRFGSAAGQFFKDRINGGGDRDILSFTAAGAIDISGKDLGANTVSGVELLRFTGSGKHAITLTNAFLQKNHDAGGYLHILNASLTPGAGSNDLSVDASAVTNKSLGVDVEIHGMGRDILKGGAGDDIFDFAGNLGGGGASGADFSDRISGGGGKDTVLVHEGSSATLGPNVSAMEVVLIQANSKMSGSLTDVSIGTDDSMTIDGRSLGAQDVLAVSGTAIDPNTLTPHQATGKLTILGGAGGDTLIGGLGADVISGGNGSDTIFGRPGGDQLTGGNGADAFVYSDLTDSTVAAAGSDTITDFSHAEGDLIFFLHSSGSPFSFISNNNFGHHAGEVRYTFSGQTTLVQLDQNGDGTADFQIVLDGKIDLVNSDFSL